MSKIKTLTQLNNQISSEFAWRKKELHDLKTIVSRNKNSYLCDLTVRSAIALLYAHWEGFIKRVGAAYLEFVSRQELLYSELADGFLAVSVKAILQNAAPSRKIENHLEVVRFFRSKLNLKSDLPHKNVINTASNLNSEVLHDIVILLGLDYGPYATKEKLIDEKLLKNRNAIAHGDFMTVDADDYSNLHDDILALMQLFYNQIDNSAIQKHYKVQAKQQATHLDSAV